MLDPLEELQQTLQDALERLEEISLSEPKQSEEEYPKAEDLVWSDTPLKTIDNILNQLYLDGISDAGTGGAMEDTCGVAKQAILQHFQQEQELTLKQGFYAGQANAGIKLEQAHKNWKEWSGYMLRKVKQQDSNKSG